MRGSAIGNLTELGPHSGRVVAIRLIPILTLGRRRYSTVARNKAGDWSRWYKTAIPAAETGPIGRGGARP
ncbi:MAG: hypothetical protein ACQSGP_22885 [Frankia sp.]